MFNFRIGTIVKDTQRKPHVIKALKPIPDIVETCEQFIEGDLLREPVIAVYVDSSDVEWLEPGKTADILFGILKKKIMSVDSYLNGSLLVIFDGSHIMTEMVKDSLISWFTGVIVDADWMKCMKA